MGTCTAERLAEMVVEMENVSKLRITKCEVSEDKELLKGKCEKCGEEFILSLDRRYILCTKAEFYATKEANRQLNKDVEELQSEVEKYRKAFEDAKKEHDCQVMEYRKKIKEMADRTILELLTEPIDVANFLINGLGASWHYDSFDVSELRQIAEHLLIYCNHNGEAEE